MDLRMEVSDFKTFHNFTLRETADISLIAIIGLNGSGKSNLVDAFLYVLGENRNKTLRIQRIADIIRVGATSCQVKLVLHGSHAFIRATNARGNSSYKYNNEEKSCQEYMKIITDVGVIRCVGVYFMLQSNIQSFAEQKDKDMTKCLERVSGSIEYQAAHERQLKLLAEHEEEMTKRRAEKNNLNRRLRRTKAQIIALEGTTYLKEQQAKLAILSALFTAHQLSMQLEDASNKFAAKSAEIAQGTADLQAEEERIVQQEPQNVIDARALVQSTRTKIQDAQVTKDELCMKITSEKREGQSLEQRNEGLMTALKKIEARIKKLTEERFAKQQAIMQGNVVDERALADYHAIQERLANLHTIGIEDLKRAMLTKYFKPRLQRHEKNIKVISGKYEHYKHEALRWRASLKEFEGMLVNTTLEALNLHIRKTSEDLRRVRDQVTKREAFLVNSKNQQAVAATEELQSRLVGVFGRLRDAITLKSKSLKPAIAAGLDDMLDATLVDTMRTALRCVMLLKGGEGDDRIAKFLINNPEYAAGTAATGILANIPDSKLLSDTLRVENLLRPALLKVCNAIVVTTGDAHAISQNMGRKITALQATSKVGEAYSKNGAVTVYLPERKPAAHADDLDMLIGEMRACVERLCDNYAQMADCVTRIDTVRKRNESKCKLLKEAEYALEQYGQYLVRLKIERNETIRKSESLSDVYALSHEQGNDWAKFCEEHNYETVQSFEAIAFSDGAHANAQNERIRNQLDEKLRAEHDEHTILTNELKELNLKIKQHKDKLKKLEEEKSLLCKKLEELEQYLQTHLIVEWENASGVLLQIISAKQDALGHARRKLIQLKSKIDEATNAINAHRMQCERNHIILPRNDDESLDLHELPIALLTKMPPRAFEAKLQRYEMEREVIQDELRQTTSNRNESIEEERDALEEEHMVAVRRYEEARARWNANRLEEVKLREARSKRLTDLLNQLDAKLDQIYKKLNGHPGACAKILPISAERPYEDGISYMCSAPGKPYSRIPDLSGGQRSMAALALYFALWECKPSALFFLDEVDVSMDCANVDKLAHYLNAHRPAGLQKTFLVTHKPEMAASADELLELVELPNEDGDLKQGLMKLHLGEFK